MTEKWEARPIPDSLTFGDDHLVIFGLTFICYICKEPHSIELRFHPIVGGAALRQTEPIVFPCGRKSIVLCGVSDGVQGKIS